MMLYHPPEAAHAWVIDGYDSEDYFRCNWGWSGSGDGWYSIGGFNPLTYDFNEWQGAVTYIEPRKATGVETPNLSPQSFIYYPNGYGLTISPVLGATSYEWTTNKGTIVGNGTSATLYANCNATVSVRAYNNQCNIYSPYDSEVITITYGTMTGNSTICNPSETFYISNVPSGCTVSWAKSDNLSFDNEFGNPKTFTPNGTGVGWIQPTINSTSCGSIMLPRKDVWVGDPPYPVITSNSPYVWSTEYSYPAAKVFTLTGPDIYLNDASYTSNLPNIFDWEWSSDNNGYIYSTGEGGIMFMPSGPGVVRIRTKVSNTCSETEWSEPVFIVVPEEFLMAPNPASEILNITINNTQNKKIESSIPSTTIPISYTIRIYDNLGAKKYETIKSMDNFTIPVGNLMNGNYIVEVNNGKTCCRKQLVIKR